MQINELLIREFDQEMASTQKTLERVPADKWDWKPQEKSGSLGWMAAHVATLPGFTTATIQTHELDTSCPHSQNPARKRALRWLASQTSSFNRCGH